MSLLLRINLIEDVLSFLVKYYCSGLVNSDTQNCESLCTCIGFGYRLILVSYQSLSTFALAKKIHVMLLTRIKIHYASNVQQIYLFSHLLGFLGLRVLIYTFMIKLTIWTFVSLRLIY